MEGPLVSLSWFPLLFLLILAKKKTKTNSTLKKCLSKFTVAYTSWGCHYLISILNSPEIHDFKFPCVSKRSSDLYSTLMDTLQIFYAQHRAHFRRTLIKQLHRAAAVLLWNYFVLRHTPVSTVKKRQKFISKLLQDHHTQ